MTLSADERAAIASRHHPTTLRTYQPRAGRYTGRVREACDHDSEDWPCDTEKMRAALVAAEADVAKLGDGLVQWMEAAKAEEARAKALADRLQSHVDQHWSHGGGFAAKDCGICIPDLAALAAYREATP